jgi:hypothetical protein
MSVSLRNPFTKISLENLLKITLSSYHPPYKPFTTNKGNLRTAACLCIRMKHPRFSNQHMNVLSVSSSEGRFSKVKHAPRFKKLKLSHYRPRRRRCSSNSYSTSAVYGDWSASRPGRVLAPGKGPPVPIVQEAGWAPEPVWGQRLQEKSFRLCRDRTSIARSSSP